MFRNHLLLGRIVFSLVLSVLCLAFPALAEVTVSGDIDPATDPTTWTTSTTVYVGKTADGTLRIDEASLMNSYRVYLGYGSGAVGDVTVDGAGSTWTNRANLYVGYDGSGELNITNGGTVNRDNIPFLFNITASYIGYESGSTGAATVDGSGSTWATNHLYVGYNGQVTLNISHGGEVEVAGVTGVASLSGSSGSIHFDGGTLTTGSLLAGQDQLTGTGTINTHGLIIDMDLVFASAADLTKTMTFNSLPDQNITVNLEVDGSGMLGAGYTGQGSISVQNGMEISSGQVTLGAKPGSIGAATVDGAGSCWVSSSGLTVGDQGHGVMDITHGGQVSSSGGTIGSQAGSSGVVNVDGSGSTWVMSDTDLNYCYVGYEGNGTLNITNGGQVSGALAACIGTQAGSVGAVTVDGAGSTWNSGSSSGFFYVGGLGSGTLDITGGGQVNSLGRTTIGLGGSGKVVVDGAGSTWNIGPAWLDNREFTVRGALSILNGASVNNNNSQVYIGAYGSSGKVTVDGAGSVWNNWGSMFHVGYEGTGILEITHGGQVSSWRAEINDVSVVTVDGVGSGWVNRDEFNISGTLNILNGARVDTKKLSFGGKGMVNLFNDGLLTMESWGVIGNDSAIHMGSGGTLAIWGDSTWFMNKALYWDGSDWASLTGATYGVHYTLDYFTEGDLAGYTVLTVMAVPEPATLSLLGFGTLALLRRRSR